MADENVLAKAYSEGWILITNDKGFGEMVFRERRPHRGVVFLRLYDEGAASKINAVQRVLAAHADQLPDAFVVVTEQQIRFATIRHP